MTVFSIKSAWKWEIDIIFQMLIGKSVTHSLMRLTSVVLSSWISSITSKISWIVGWPWSNHVCVCVCECASVSICNRFYKLIHWPQKQILVFFLSGNLDFGLEKSRKNHGTFSWWRHQMETFSALLAFVRGIHRSPEKSLHKGQWCRALMFTLICARKSGWVNNREAGDLRCHRAHYDVIVMFWDFCGNPVDGWGI